MILIRTPASGEALRNQVASTIARRLPELPQYPARDLSTLTIVANGPSARDLPDEALTHGNTLVVNGALALFTARGLVPRWWLALDPQPIVAGFLRDPPVATQYLAASQCHDAVFGALADRRVKVWHVHNPATRDLIPASRPVACCGVSATLAAIAVGRGLLGFRRIETFGWDGCVIDGADHAAPQASNARIGTYSIGGRDWQTSSDWLVEAEDAVQRLQFLKARVRVHGPGLIGSVLRAANLAT